MLQVLSDKGRRVHANAFIPFSTENVGSKVV